MLYSCSFISESQKCWFRFRFIILYGTPNERRVNWPQDSVFILDPNPFRLFNCLTKLHYSKMVDFSPYIVCLGLRSRYDQRILLSGAEYVLVAGEYKQTYSVRTFSRNAFSFHT